MSVLTAQELIERLRTNLVPGGNAPIVKLQIGSYGFMDYDTVQAAVDRLEQIMMLHDVLNEKANALEAIGIRVLLDSIYYDWDKHDNNSN